MSRPSPAESARLLRQRAELGGGELFLDGLTRLEALALARAAAEGRASEPVPNADPVGKRGRPPSVESPAKVGGPTRRTTQSPKAAQSGRPPGAGAAGTPSTDGRAAGVLPVLPDDYDELREMALGCTCCRLADGRTNVVFSDGPPDARLMVVGEAPGANEDKTGLPFVGAAGKYLDLLLATVDLSRAESVYICNVLKCRPPLNRNPMPDEIELCSPFLKKQIELVRPEVLLAVGSFSAQLLTGREKTALGKLRGEVHSYHGVPLVVTYHPAALLRNPKWTRAFWDDLQLLRTLMES